MLCLQPSDRTLPSWKFCPLRQAKLDANKMHGLHLFCNYLKFRVLIDSFVPLRSLRYYSDVNVATLIDDLRVVFCIIMKTSPRAKAFNKNVLQLHVHLHANQTHFFYMKTFERGLVLEQRQMATQNGLQWNLDLTRSPGTGQTRSLNRGLVISKFFFIYLTITRARNTVRYIEVFVKSRFHCIEIKKINVIKPYGILFADSKEIL